MRAVEYGGYGSADVLVVREVQDVSNPAAGQILVDVVAASVNPKDTFVRKGRFRALTGESFPRRTGYDFSGVVAGVHVDDAEFIVGQPVYGMLNDWAGGTCADLVLVSTSEVAAAPLGAPLSHMAALPLAGLTALQALSDIDRVGPGNRVLMNGASGGVGLFAVQIAHALGAEVTAIAGSNNEMLCRDAGADQFIDYVLCDPFDAPTRSFDVVFDVFGNRSLAAARSALHEHGIYISTVPSKQIFIDIAATNDEQGPRARLVDVHSNRADLECLAKMTNAGELRPIIDSEFPLGSMADAHKRVETKHTQGKVIVKINC